MAIPIEPFSLTYYPIPKCGSSSVKFMLLQRCGRAADVKIPENEIHHLSGFYTKLVDPFRALDDSHPRRITIVRDPLERLISAYQDRLHRLGDPAIIEAGLPPYPDLDTFFSNIAEYCAASHDLRYHVASIRYHIGCSLWAFHRIFKLEQIEQLSAFLRDTFGEDVDIPKLRVLENRILPSDLSDRALRVAMRFCRHDYGFLVDLYTPNKWGGIPTGEIDDFSSMFVYKDRYKTCPGKPYRRTPRNLWRFVKRESLQ